MRIWIDADACPKVIKEILYRVAKRTQIPLTLVANMQLQHPKSAYIDSVHVAAGADVADIYIIDNAELGDLVITADIPFAASVVEKGCFALNPRGELYTTDNVRTALSIRNMLDEMRCNGVITGGPQIFNHGDWQAFANQLDRFIAKHWKQNNRTRST